MTAILTQSATYSISALDAKLQQSESMPFKAWRYQRVSINRRIDFLLFNSNPQGTVYIVQSQSVGDPLSMSSPIGLQ